MTIDDFKKHLENAVKNGSLLIPKHDPHELGTTYDSFRTVLSHDVANNLDSFILSGNYTVREFENNKFPKSPYYFEITPNPNSGFLVPASGVCANSIFATSVVDKLVAVSGNSIGWHLFGEDSNAITTKIKNGELTLKNIQTLK
jgi:hypothetical protein